MLQEKMDREAEATKRRAKAVVKHAVRRKRKAMIENNMFIDGKPTEMAYVIAQALAHI